MDRLKFAMAVMTPKQRRRYKFFIKGWSLTRIAKKEGVSVVAVHYSIKAGENKAKKRGKGLKST